MPALQLVALPKATQLVWLASGNDVELHDVKFVSEPPAHTKPLGQGAQREGGVARYLPGAQVVSGSTQVSLPGSETLFEGQLTQML